MARMRAPNLSTAAPTKGPTMADRTEAMVSPEMIWVRDQPVLNATRGAMIYQ